MLPLVQVGAAYIAMLLAAHQGPEAPKAEVPAWERPAAQVETISLGHPYSGKLKKGIMMPAEGPYHTIQRSTRYRRWTYGTAYLIRALLSTAQDIQERYPGGERLVLGNLSRRGGGDIRMSRSHNTGRDVDMAYYTADPEGRSVVSDYHSFGPDGLSTTAPAKFQLDLPRNWAFVKAMLLNPEAETQWIITAPFIERRLLDHARQAGEPEWLLERASRVMMLPAWAKLHDNHIHLRVLCSPRDWERGCVNGGPVWPWNAKMLAALERAHEGLKPALAGTPREQIKALKRIARRGITPAIADIAPLLRSSSREVRKQSLTTLLSLTDAATAGAVLKLARRCDATVGAKLIVKAIKHAGPDGVEDARELVTGTHPIQTHLRRKKSKPLIKAARRLLNAYADETAPTPGG